MLIRPRAPRRHRPTRQNPPRATRRARLKQAGIREDFMAPDRPTCQPVNADIAVAQILEWWRDGGPERSIEVLGGTGSGRTDILLRV